MIIYFIFCEGTPFVKDDTLYLVLITIPIRY